MKKLIFVIQIDVDGKYEEQIRHAFYYIEQKIVNLFKGKMKFDEVKVDD